MDLRTICFKIVTTAQYVRNIVLVILAPLVFASTCCEYCFRLARVLVLNLKNQGVEI
jgi:hypothetical protein